MIGRMVAREPRDGFWWGWIEEGPRPRFAPRSVRLEQSMSTNIEIHILYTEDETDTSVTQALRTLGIF